MEQEGTVHIHQPLFPVPLPPAFSPSQVVQNLDEIIPQVLGSCRQFRVENLGGPTPTPMGDVARTSVSGSNPGSAAVSRSTSILVHHAVGGSGSLLASVGPASASSVTSTGSMAGVAPGSGGGALGAGQVGGVGAARGTGESGWAWAWGGVQRRGRTAGVSCMYPVNMRRAPPKTFPQSQQSCMLVPYRGKTLHCS